MRLSKLDSLQNRLVRKPDFEHGCHDCFHCEIESDGLHCEHPLNSEIQDIRVFFGVPSVVGNYLRENDLYDSDSFDLNIGSYCSEHQLFDYPEEDDEYHYVNYGSEE